MQLLCDSPDSLSDETRHLEHVFQINNYNPDFIKLNNHRNIEPNDKTNNSTPVTTVTIPYHQRYFWAIARILQPYDIRVAHKPITTLWHVLTNVKDKDQRHDRQERCSESNVLAVRLLILGRLAETWRKDWLNTNERTRMVIPGITFLNTLD